MPRPIEPVVFQFEGYNTEARIYWWSIFLLSPIFFGFLVRSLEPLTASAVRWRAISELLEARRREAAESAPNLDSRS